MTRLAIPCVIASLVIAVASPIKAQTATDALRTFNQACQAFRGHDLPVEDTLAALIQLEGSRLEVPLLRAYRATVDANLSPEAGPTLANYFGSGAARLNGTLLVLYDAGFGENPPPPSDEVQASVRTRSLSGPAWASAYLSGDLNLLTIHCPLPTSDSPETPTPRRLIVTGDIAGLSEAALDDRTFATVSYANDRESDSESFNIDLVVGLGSFGRGAVRWVPYVSYERESLSSTPLNDLTFGATGFWQDEFHEVRWNAAFETDDEFESAVYLADLEWNPPPLRGCGRRIGSSGILGCTYGFRLDYAQVADAGAKSSLANVEDYFRVGGWFSLTYGQSIRSGWLAAELRYQLMEPLIGDSGDAARGTASLVLSPSERSNYRFGLTYENGEDITSLVRSEVLKVVLGVRY